MPTGTRPAFGNDPNSLANLLGNFLGIKQDAYGNVVDYPGALVPFIGMPGQPAFAWDTPAASTFDWSGLQDAAPTANAYAGFQNVSGPVTSASFAPNTSFDPGSGSLLSGSEPPVPGDVPPSVMPGGFFGSQAPSTPNQGGMNTGGDMTLGGFGGTTPTQPIGMDWGTPLPSSDQSLWTQPNFSSGDPSGAGFVSSSLSFPDTMNTGGNMSLGGFAPDPTTGAGFDISNQGMTFDTSIPWDSGQGFTDPNVGIDAVSPTLFGDTTGNMNVGGTDITDTFGAPPTNDITGFGGNMSLGGPLPTDFSSLGVPGSGSGGGVVPVPSGGSSQGGSFAYGGGSGAGGGAYGGPVDIFGVPIFNPPSTSGGAALGGSFASAGGGAAGGGVFGVPNIYSGGPFSGGPLGVGPQFSSGRTFSQGGQNLVGTQNSPQLGFSMAPSHNFSDIYTGTGGEARETGGGFIGRTGPLPYAAPPIIFHTGYLDQFRQGAGDSPWTTPAGGGGSSSPTQMSIGLRPK